MNQNGESGQVTLRARALLDSCHEIRAAPAPIEVAARLRLVREEIALAAEAAGRDAGERASSSP